MAQQKRIIVIGGSAAGPKAAAKARRLDEFAEITIIQKSPELSMASCGYPYFVGGVFDDRNKLLCTPTGVVRNENFYASAKKINTIVNTEVININTTLKEVYFKNVISGKEGSLPYDKIVIATGALPNIPRIPGAQLEGITTLQSMKDADCLKKVTQEKQIKRAVVIGGGLIGIETLEALHLAGIELTMIELLPQLLTFLDEDMALLIQNYLATKTNVILNNGVVEFLGENNKISAVKLADNTIIPCELAVIAIGVKPNVNLAQKIGVTIGDLGGIVVDKYMQTSQEDIYAAGDCCEITNLISNKKVLAPFGDLANLEGRVAGNNVINGNTAEFNGTIQTGICKIFDYEVGVTGLNEKIAIKEGFDYDAIINASVDKPGFMNGKLLITKLLSEKGTGRILGVQCLGPGDVSKQLAIWATAIKAKLSINDVVDNDLPYAPPFSLAIDHSIASAHIMQNKTLGLFNCITAYELKQKLDNNEEVFLLDARGQDEFNETCLGLGEHLIPLGQLRNRLDELPINKNTEIVCYCKISLRGYEAALILQAYGYTNVKVLGGGLMAWPYKKLK